MNVRKYNSKAKWISFHNKLDKSRYTSEFKLVSNSWKRNVYQLTNVDINISLANNANSEENNTENYTSENILVKQGDSP